MRARRNLLLSIFGYTLAPKSVYNPRMRGDRLRLDDLLLLNPEQEE